MLEVDIEDISPASIIPPKKAKVKQLPTQPRSPRRMMGRRIRSPSN